ncbi:type VII secretion protein EssC [Fictibacillus enclensis]|uniref:type VII secretion protein EssC n=1 Tax=Fictibacillus enclensis TaxID=1017270 RepID=UPI0025A18954|nr:type VII secretion protein EssC [Fictibacillus enclensis]MDM5197128.1 type VII secretion protein EssC [Fictibacillus enclensis]
MRKSPYFKRAPRLKLAMPSGRMVVHRPKAEPSEPKFSFESMIIPIFLTLATVGIMYYISKTMYNSASYAIFMMAMSIPMLGSYIATIVIHFRKKKTYRLEVEQLHNEYYEQIKKHHAEIEDLKNRQSQFLRDKDPNPQDCVRRIADRKSSLWERAYNSEDFMDLRFGLGSRPFQLEIEVPAQDGYDVNPLIAEAQKLQTDYRELQNVPVSIPLQEKRVVGLVGDRGDILEMARVLALQLVTHQSPEEVKLVTAYTENESEQWGWMKWLPHVWDEDRERRYAAEGKLMAQKLFEQLYSKLNIRRLEQEGKDNTDVTHIPEYVFFLPSLALLEDDSLLPLILKQGDAIGASAVLMAPAKEALPMECELIVEVRDGVAQLYETFSNDEDEVVYFTGSEKIAIDHFSLIEAQNMSRMIAPLRVKQSSADVIPKVLSFLDMYGVKRVEELDVINKWNENRYPDTLPVPIGVREGRKPVYLNIHDKIEKKGHGPHGLMAGTTGSGKSEVIQSMILSLAATYHPHDMAFMLIDYKGGGMSNTFQGLPHVVANITNLEDRNLINRAKISLRAELERRQKLFNRAGNIQHIDEYFKSEWKTKEPLPHLFIIIDEFAQLKKDQPEFMDELISIAAIGRTLGVHLLLATQKPAGVVDDKIWSNSRFRVCLRVQDDNDSREMIKIPNASSINVPGRAYFQVGNNEVLEYFQSAWSGAGYHPENDEENNIVTISEVKLDGTDEVQKKIKTDSITAEKQIQVLIRYMMEEAEKNGVQPLPGPWLQPLPESLPITRLVDTDHWTSDRWNEEEKWMEPAAGIIDDVENQDQYPLHIDLKEGHLMAFGMPGTGKTTFLQSVLLSLFHHHGPRDLYTYIIDFSRQMKDFSRFPQVGGVVHEEDSEKMQRLFRYFLKELQVRKELFSNEGVSSLETYRSITKKSLPVLLLCIDGYHRFRSTFEFENEKLETILREGATYGILVFVTANQTNDMYERYRSNFTSMVAFELADPTDYYYAVGRPNFEAVNLPEGRGFVKGHNPPHIFQAMLPYNGGSELEKVSFIRELSGKMMEEAKNERAKPIQMLPSEISLNQLLDEFPPADTKLLPYGIDVEDLDIQSLDLDDADHVFVTGRVESGKTSLLQSLSLSMMYQYRPDQIDLYLVEMEPQSKGIMSMASFPHVKGYATDFMQAKELFNDIAAKMDERKTDSLSFGWGSGQEDNAYSPVVIVIDDAENFMQQMNMDFEIKDHLEKLTRGARQKNIHFMMAGSLTSMNSYMHDAWFMNIKKKFAGFLLGSTLSNDLYFFNMRLPHAETDKELPAGDGYIIKGKHTRIKAALPFISAEEQHQWESIVREKNQVLEM